MKALRTLRALPRRAGAALIEQAVRRASASAPFLPEPPEEPRSIFVLRNNDLGDLLVVTPLFEALRWRFPEAWIVAGVGDWSRDVLLHNPWVSEVVPVNAPWFNKYAAGSGAVARWRYLRRSPQVRALARRRLDVGIDVLGSSWGALLLLRAGIPWRMGVHGYAGGHSGAQATVEFNPFEPVGRSALRFAELLGVTALPSLRPQLFMTSEELTGAEHWWSTAKGTGRRLVLAPGGGLAARCWSGESWIALARGLAQRSDLSILVLDGPRERELAAAMATACPTARLYPGPPGLRQVFALLATSEMVVCNSSMPLHAAAAFDRPTLALLGPAFPSAAAHQSQWGHRTCRSLGKEPGGRPTVWTPGEVLNLIGQELAGCSRLF